MATDKEIWNRLAAYLSGHATDDEKVSVENWIAASEENKATFWEAKKIWERAGVRLHYPEIDSAQLLSEIKSKIHSHHNGGKLISLLNRPVWKIAASITLILVSYFVLRLGTRENIIIESGDKVATLYLPDSTKVWLNIHSRIVYPRQFKTREVKLSGEVFLSVRKDTSDFTVTTLNTITKVVGTAFNLKEQGDSSVTLTVAEGVVNFSSRNSANEETVAVRGHEKAVFKKAYQSIKKTKNSDPLFAKWREENNPGFEDEKNNPVKFLSNTYTWRKNQINQSVIEGSLINNASLAAYTKIVLNVTYTKPDGTTVSVDITVNDVVSPGKQLQYKRRLLDLFSDTKSVVVKLKSANVTTSNSF